MSSDLTVEKPLTLASLNTAIAPAGLDEKDFQELATTRTFLPRVQLLQPQSKDVAKKKGLAGEFLLFKGKDDFSKLGEKFICIPLAFRFKATDMRNTEKILTYFDPKSAEFLAVKEIAKGDGLTGCLAGIEFLIWISDNKEFATFYLTKTALAEAQSVRAMMLKPVWIRSKFIDTTKYSWYVPQCVPCSEPTQDPDLELAQTIINTFTNPKSSEVEIVSEEEAAQETRAR